MTDILTATLDITYCLAVIGVVKSLKYVLFSFSFTNSSVKLPAEKSIAIRRKPTVRSVMFLFFAVSSTVYVLTPVSELR